MRPVKTSPGPKTNTGDPDTHTEGQTDGKQDTREAPRASREVCEKAAPVAQTQQSRKQNPQKSKTTTEVRRSLQNENTAHKSHQDSAQGTLRSADGTGLRATEGQSDARPSPTAAGTVDADAGAAPGKLRAAPRGPGVLAAHTEGEAAAWRDGGSPCTGARGQTTRATHRRAKQALRGLPSRALVSPPGEQVQQGAGPRANTHLLPGSRDHPTRMQGDPRTAGGGPRGQDRAVDKDPEALLGRPHHAQQDTREEVEGWEPPRIALPCPGRHRRQRRF